MPGSPAAAAAKGSGYPDELRGEQIPPGSRVIAVCDDYEAVISERPYSVAMVPRRALEELRQGAGTQFDPQVVVAFERVVTGPLDPRRAVR